MPQYRDRAWRRAQRVRVIAKRKDTAIQTAYRHYPNRCRVTPCTLGLPAYDGQLAKSHLEPYFRRGEKLWSQMYFRRHKCKRAQRLGYLWPHPKAKWAALLEESF